MMKHSIFVKINPTQVISGKVQQGVSSSLGQEKGLDFQKKSSPPIHYQSVRGTTHCTLCFTDHSCTRAGSFTFEPTQQHPQLSVFARPFNDGEIFSS